MYSMADQVREQKTPEQEAREKQMARWEAIAEKARRNFQSTNYGQPTGSTNTYSSHVIGQNSPFNGGRRSRRKSRKNKKSRRR